MYIAIEGIKGSGKSTLLNQLYPNLKQLGFDFISFNPTRPMPDNHWFEQAYSQFADDDEYRSALYTARANYHASNTDFSHPLVLGDRSILTSLVTRWQPNNMRSYVNEIRQKEYKVPTPDAVLYLDISIDEVQKRLKSRERNYGLHDEKLDRLIQAQHAYQTIFTNKTKLGLGKMQVILINANNNAEAVLQATSQAIVKLSTPPRLKSIAA